MPAAPRTDPGKRNYRTGLLPRIRRTGGRPPIVAAPALVAGPPCGTGLCVPWAWFADAASPWPGPFPPSPPQPVAHHRPCSETSQVLWACPTSRIRASPSCPFGSRRGLEFDTQADPGISRLPRELLRCVPGVLDSAGPGRSSRWRTDRCCLPRDITASASRTLRISELNTQPALSPVNASPVSSRITTHDSEPTWLARPSSCETFIHCTSPALPAHVAVGTAVARRPPHRSRRAELPHRALASGDYARAACPRRIRLGTCGA